jgi:hypothetical protein
VGQHLKAWQPQAPKFKEDRVDPAQVSTIAIQLDAEQAVAERNSPASDVSDELEARDP